MTKEEHLAILDRGAEAWNRWREEHKDETVDLSDTDLRKRDFRGYNFTRANFLKANLSEADFRKANLSFAVLKSANLSHANLDHANLSHANLDRALLTLARMENAVFFFASLKGADLRGAHLSKATLEDASLRRANLSHAHLEKAVLAFADCYGVDFVRANLTGTNLTATNLEKANVSSVVFDDHVFWRVVRKTRLNPLKLWERRRDITLDSTIRCKGVNAACYGSQRFAGFLKGQDFLEELLDTRKGRMICAVWWLFADCGRSFLRWGFWSLTIIFLFGTVYTLLGPRDFHLATLKFNLGAMMYYSVVTFSTLGFGDIIPCTPASFILTGFEVFTGYFMMGGLISIFATKLARAAK